MDEIQLLDGFRGEAFATLPCQDGGGSIARYPLFDGVNALLVRLQTHGFEELRDQRDQLEINFCISGRFESVFSLREQAMLTPGGLSVSCFDGLHGAHSTSLFPLGYYEGLCLQIDCAAATRWMQRHVAPLAVDLSALRANLLGSRWFMLGEAGPRCEHVLRELYENLPYFDREYLQLKVLELLMLLRSMPRVERETEYCSAEQVRLVSHLRDHLLTERDSYVSLSRLAEEHHLSVSHLQKLFRQVYGAPIYRYLKEYRLEKAAVELSGSEQRIVEIALDAGYESASKFSSAFKQRYGVTPSAYRFAARCASKRDTEIKTE